jgi:hypothetical protein
VETRANSPLNYFLSPQGVKLSKLIRHELYGWKPSQGLTALFNPYVINVAADSIYAIKFIYADNKEY